MAKRRGVDWILICEAAFLIIVATGLILSFQLQEPVRRCDECTCPLNECNCRCEYHCEGIWPEDWRGLDRRRMED